MEVNGVNIELLKEALSRIDQTKPAPPPPPPNPVVKGLWYQNKVVKLDGWFFEACRFDNCQLIIATQYFALKECFIDSSNEIVLEGSIINAVQLANFDKEDYQGQHAYWPKRSYDGKITIGV
ncbi:hypothetical protein VT47_20160 [Pseudomonas syringae pv. syringae]|uniref:hypothetical protein n=1 Tax=Pseudomonas syringae TaxID=317 RepID=UPI0007AE7623|nr:hypothetical protein [Pseudomonas syringae]KZL37547.1 hypothetical protein VT47_20160 [Pseudomonas syringae pv. syringae]